MFISSPIPITNTLNLISKCWKIAELNIQKEIREYYPDVGEEFITRLFYGKLARIFKIANKKKRFEDAFVTDLQESFVDLQYHPELSDLGHGLTVNITLHKRHTESLTGGDFGLMIIRPQIELSESFLVPTDYRRGILCQAKLKHSKNWGRLTKKQRKVLPERLQYLALLLYQYKNTERNILEPFQWQICESANDIETVQTWLKNDDFPSVITSDEVIIGLGNAKIGTDDDDILDEIVSVANNPSLVIKIGWAEEKRPPTYSIVVWSTASSQQEKEINEIRQGF